ncbi:NAD-dependent epimerase/dehydratase family protein [Desulfobacterium sp. N47]|uniref:NAD-dependent epimerase/dehydratase domain-containing protein n=1 Tax=uncultured Desulfobacterium sp. TaxID=201089 RepID=E1YL63_9BACT|nr:hypothetical protein N47_E43580 [uncultured Desulfobacterium sp.]
MDLVIGGSGFIGCRLVEILKRSQHRVRVFDVNSFPVDEPLQPDDMVLGSILDMEELKSALKGCQSIYHLAANPMLWHQQPKVFDQVNRQGTENVAKAVCEADVNRLVYTSTESILVPRKHRGPVTEDVQTSLADMIGPYCRSKFFAERSIADLAKRGFPAVIVNPTMPIGPCDRNLTPPGKMIRDFLLGKINGYMDGVLNLVDVRDVAEGHFLAMEQGSPCKRYILGGSNLPVKDFFDRLAAISGCPAPRFKVPYLLALGFAYLEEGYANLTDRHPLSSVTGIRLLRRSLVFDSARTWRQLGGHTIRPLENTLEETVFWHRQRLIEDGIKI